MEKNDYAMNELHRTVNAEHLCTTYRVITVYELTRKLLATEYAGEAIAIRDGFFETVNQKTKGLRL